MKMSISPDARSGRRVSIVQARDHLPALVHAAEAGDAVELTRRGQPVAVILSLEEYRRMMRASRAETGDLWSAIERLREQPGFAEAALGPEIFEGIRDRSPGRACARHVFP